MLNMWSPHGTLHLLVFMYLHTIWQDCCPITDIVRHINFPKDKTMRFNSVMHFSSFKQIRPTYEWTRLSIQFVRTISTVSRNFMNVFAWHWIFSHHLHQYLQIWFQSEEKVTRTRSSILHFHSNLLCSRGRSFDRRDLTFSSICQSFMNPNTCVYSSANVYKGKPISVHPMLTFGNMTQDYNFLSVFLINFHFNYM